MLIELQNITIGIAGKTLLEHVNFYASEGELIYLTGRVGAGKSTLLKTLYGELLPVGNEGEAQILGYDLHTLRRKHIPALRRQLGIVFQDFQLLSDRTVFENLDFVLCATGWKKKSARSERINEVLSEVELEDKAHYYPHQLSGGEQRRIAVARAMLGKPKIILADEPTGNLDRDNAVRVLSLLRDACERGAAVIVVTHNLELLQQFPGIVYRCENGKVKEMSDNASRRNDSSEGDKASRDSDTPVAEEKE